MLFTIDAEVHADPIHRRGVPGDGVTVMQMTMMANSEVIVTVMVLMMVTEMVMVKVIVMLTSQTPHVGPHSG
jgi:hypothetical protein